MTITDWIQAISTVILVIVTGIYAWRTHSISVATQKQADASAKMAEEMREQRYDTVRPVIDIQMEESPDAQISAGLAAQSGSFAWGLSCKLHNIGLGPAVDVYSFIQSQRECRRFDFGTIAAGERTKKEASLSVTQEDSSLVLKVYYKDIYGRDFESRREVLLYPEKTGLELGPLKICKITEEELPK